MASGQKESEDLLREVAKDFTSLLDVKDVKEKEHFMESLDEVLVKLEKSVDDVDLIRIDSTMALETTMNEIKQRCQDMDGYFEKIDKLEAFLNLVKGQVKELEAAVEKAYSDINVNPIKKALSVIPFFKKKASSSISEGFKYEPTQIFDSNLYFTTKKMSMSAEMLPTTSSSMASTTFSMPSLPIKSTLQTSTLAKSTTPTSTSTVSLPISPTTASTTSSSTTTSTTTSSTVTSKAKMTSTITSIATPATIEVPLTSSSIETIKRISTPQIKKTSAIPHLKPSKPFPTLEASFTSSVEGNILSTAELKSSSNASTPATSPTNTSTPTTSTSVASSSIKS